MQNGQPSADRYSYVPVGFVAMLLILLAQIPVLGCKVTNVDLRVGRTVSIAHNDELTTAYVGKPFACCVNWTADTPDTKPFEYIYEEKIGTVWYEISEVAEFPATWRHTEPHHWLALGYGVHTIRIKVRRKDVETTWGEDTESNPLHGHRR